MPYALLHNTPSWVWALLAGLLIVGMRQTLSRNVGFRKATILPLALVGFSLYGVSSAFGSSALALMVWAQALLAVTLWVQSRPLPKGTHFDVSSSRFTIAGSWVPLGVMMGIFWTKYAMGVLASTAPAVLQSPAVMIALCAVLGTFSGVILGRTVTLWRMAMRADQAALAQPQAAPFVRAI